MKGLINASNDIDFEETWTALETALHEMHTKNASALSFESIYRHAYKVVLKKKGEVFYGRLQNFEKEWLSGRVRKDLQELLVPSLLGSSDGTNMATTVNEKRNAGERFLKGLKDAFDDHQLVMNLATDVFMYMDRVFCQDEAKPTIYSAGMMHFKDCILRSPAQNGQPEMLVVLGRIILEQIAMERDGDIIDKGMIRGCTYMLESLYESHQELEDERLYATSFEALFLDASREFYRLEGAKLLDEADAATYCRHTLKRIHEERDRCSSTLSQSTTPKITTVLEDELIRSKLRQLILMDSGVKHMVDNDLFDDLELIFDLNARIDPKKSDLTMEIQRRVQEVGTEINNAATNLSNAPQNPPEKDKSEGESRPTINQQTVAALQWVEGILSLKDKYDHLWKVSFQSDPVIQPALTRSFTESINSFNRRSEFISLFIDENMKKGLKDKTEAEVDAVLEKAIVLLRYIQDKDMFERYYKKHLCKRLLMGKSISIDVEKQMISRMKIELGNSFTSKLEAMFKDMALSEELTNSYRNRVAGADETRRAELSISVLTSMTWPLEYMQSSNNEPESRKKCIFPPSIERVKQGFEAFYAEKHSGRMLTWMANMGTADIRAVFPKIPEKEGRLGRERRHDLNVSTFAMVILLLFNDLPPGESFTFEEIQEKTNIDTGDLIRNLQSLAVAPKTRLLLKEPMSKDVKPTDRFSFNSAFQSNFLKIKVGVVAAGNKVEGEKERMETEKKNNDSRGFAVEAAVVRIMK